MTYLSEGEDEISLTQTPVGIEQYSYNPKNQLTGYINEETEAEYGYNADGTRKYKTVNGISTGFVWNGANLAAEVTSNTTNKYYYGADGIVSANVGGADKYYLKNAHGDVMGAVDGNGTLLQNNNYDAFGNRLTDNTDPFGYCGEYYDAETGNIYLRNRYYDSAIGQFITEDPIKDGLNWYGYCDNNPVMFIDFWGLKDVPLRDFVEERGGSVTWNQYQKAAIVNFGSAGTKMYRAGTYKPLSSDSSSSENPYLKYDYVDGKTTLRMYINDQDIINDFGIKDSINTYSGKYNAYVTFTLFEKSKKTYQRFVINYKEIKYEKVNFNSYNYYTPSFVSGRHWIGIGPVTDNTLYWQNGEWKDSVGDWLSAAGESVQHEMFSNVLSIAGDVIGMVDLSEQKVFRGDVHVGFGQMHYYLNPKGWILRDL